MGQARLGVPKIHNISQQRRTPNALGRPMSLKTKTPNHAQACQEHEDSQEVTPKVEVQDQKGDNKLCSKGPAALDEAGAAGLVDVVALHA